MNFRFFRRFFYEIHLWLGIVIGIILFVVCLSGSIYTFREEIQRLAEPGRYYVEIPKDATPLPVDELIAKIETAKPSLKVASITIPEKSNRTVTMMLASPNQSEGRSGHGGGRDRNVVYADPYTGEIVGEGANIVDPFFMSMMRLHRYLWLPTHIGRPIVGVATILFVVICLSGLVLWLPRTWNAFTRRRAWKSGLQIRFKKGVWPLIYDLHRTVGFYLLIPALILALIGLCWSFAWYRDATSYILGDQVFKQRMQRPKKIEPPTNPMQPLAVGEMIARQEKLTPGPGEISVSIPQDNETALVIQKGRTGFLALSIKDKTQWDRFRGTVVPVEHHGKTVEVERFADKPLGAKIAASIRAIHFGDITGLSSKIFFFIVCLFATSWLITGAVLWIRKLRTRHVRIAKSRVA